MDGGMTGMELRPGQDQREPDDASRAELAPFDLEPEAFVQQMRKWFTEAYKVKLKKIERRKRDREMYAGHHWRDEDRRIAEQAKRPVLTLNMMVSIISAVEGEERENRQDIKFFADDAMRDVEANGLNLIVKWVMNECLGEYARSRQFRDATICGESWIVPEVDYFDDPEGKISLDVIDDEQIVDDELSKDPTDEDGRFIFRMKQVTEAELNARFPGSAERVRNSMDRMSPGFETDGKGFRDVYSVPNDLTSAKLYDAKSKTYLLIEGWWKQIEPGHVVKNPDTGLLEEMTPDEYQAFIQAHEKRMMAALQARIDAAAGGMPMSPPMGETMQPPMMGPEPMLPPMPAPIEAIERPIRRLYQMFMCGGELLKREPCPMKRLKRFPYVPFRAYRDDAKGDWFGLIRLITDPQLQHNVEQSVIVQLMQLMPKASWMGPKGSFHNKQEWEGKLSKPGALLEYNIARGGKPEPIPTPPIPRHLIDMAFARPEQMRAISGVNVELTGQRQGSDPGVVMQQRKQAAKTVLAPIFDNYRLSTITLGKVLLCYIQQYVSVGRKIAILGPNRQPQAVAMTQGMKDFRYSLTIDQADTSINERFEALYVLQTTLPQMMKAGVPLVPGFADLLPLPPALRDEWKRQIAWTMTINNQLPPPGWQPGQPVPMQPPMLAAPPSPQPEQETGQ